MHMAVPNGERASFNYYRVLRSIWQSHGISRTDLASAYGLDKTTVSQIVGDLVDQGIVRVADIDSSSAGPGRKAELLTVDERWGMVAGIEVRADGVNACATDLAGNVLATHHHRQIVERSNLHDTFDRTLEGLLADDRVSDRPLIGVGVGVTGIVAKKERTIVRSLPLNIADPYDFGHQIARKLPVPVILDNDANCCAWGELVYDASRAPSNFLFVLLEFRSGPEQAFYGGDIGMGLGFVIDGSVYYGGDGSAGEFRSLYWHPGFRNQFAVPDSEASGILERPDVLVRLVDEIAKHVALFVNTLNLKRVYIGGDVGTIKDLLIGTIETAIENNWPYDEPVGCGVELATHAQDIVAVGAAAMVLEHVFEEPALSMGLRERNSLWQQIMAHRLTVQTPARGGHPVGR